MRRPVFFQQERGKDQRILILDNHDDFGGHAKRNEFTSQGHMLLGVGGSVFLENPLDYSKVSRRLLKDIGIDIAKLGQNQDLDYPLTNMGARKQGSSLSPMSTNRKP